MHLTLLRYIWYITTNYQDLVHHLDSLAIRDHQLLSAISQSTESMLGEGYTQLKAFIKMIIIHITC